MDLRTFQANSKDITITDTSMSVASLNTRNHTVFTQKDYYGTEVDQDLEFTAGITTGQAVFSLISFSEIGGDLYAKQLSGTLLSGIIVTDNSILKLYMMSFSNGVQEQPLLMELTAGTKYYLHITKSGTSAILSLYSGPNHTGLLASESVTLSLNDSYTNQSIFAGYNTVSSIPSSLTLTIENVIDNLDTFSIYTLPQRVDGSTINVRGVAPALATVNWSGTNGTVSGSTTADGNGDWEGLVTIGLGTENVLTLTTTGEDDQILSITQGGVDYAIDSAVIDTSIVPESVIGPYKSTVSFNGLFVESVWIEGGNTKIKLGTDEGSGLGFKTLQTALAGYGTPATLSMVDDVYSSFHTTTLSAGELLEVGKVLDDYSVNYDYEFFDDPGASYTRKILDEPIISSIIDNENITYVVTRGISVVNVRDSKAVWFAATDAFVTPSLIVPISANPHVEPCTNLYVGNDNTKLLLVCSTHASAYAELDLYTSADGLTWSAATSVATDVVDAKYFRGAMTSDGQLRIFYCTEQGLKCRVLSTSLVLGGEVNVLDNVTAFTATAVNSKDDRIQIGITKSPYLLSYIYDDGVLDTVPVELYDDVQAANTYTTSPTIEPQTVPFMFQNFDGHYACATSKYTLSKRSTLGYLTGIGRTEFGGAILATHKDGTFDKSIVSFGGRDDWGMFRSFNWDTLQFEAAANRGVTSKRWDFHNRLVTTLSGDDKFWAFEGGRNQIPIIRVTDDEITTGSIINLTDLSLVSPQPTIEASYKDILVDDLGRIFLVHKNNEDQVITVYDNNIWTSYVIVSSSARAYWHGSQFDINEDIHICYTFTDLTTIPNTSRGTTNTLRVDYLKLTYTGSGFTAVNSAGTPVTLPTNMSVIPNVITAPSAIAYYGASAGFNANAELTTTALLTIGLMDRRALCLSSTNNPIIGGLQVDLVDYETAVGIYVYRWTGTAWESITITTTAGLAARPPIMVKSLDGASIVCIYTILLATKYKVSSDDGATWGAEKTLFDTTYPIENIYPAPSVRGLDLVSEQFVDRSYSEVVLDSVQFAFGSIQITIEDDSGDPVTGATYSIDGEGSYISGEIVPDVLVGSRLISFNQVVDYTKPVDYNITVEDGATATDTAVYTLTPNPLPNIDIDTPSTNPTYTINVDNFTLAGTTSISEGSVASVSWADNRGNSGNCTGTANWTTDINSVVEGVTIYTVTATSDLGETNTDTLTITYSPAVELGNINLSSNWPTGSTVTIDGSVYTSNTVISLSPGAYPCVPSTVEGYTTPDTQTATVINQQTTNITFTWGASTIVPAFRKTFNPLLSMSFRFLQSENAVARYNGNWGPVIQPKTILASTWAVINGNAVTASDLFSETETSCIISGQPGEHTIVNKVTLSDGQVDERKILLKILSNDDPQYRDDYGR